MTLAALAGVTVLTTVGLVKLSVTDISLTESIPSFRAPVSVMDELAALADATAESAATSGKSVSHHSRARSRSSGRSLPSPRRRCGSSSHPSRSPRVWGGGLFCSFSVGRAGSGCWGGRRRRPWTGKTAATGRSRRLTAPSTCSCCCSSSSSSRRSRWLRGRAPHWQAPGSCQWVPCFHASAALLASSCMTRAAAARHRSCSPRPSLTSLRAVAGDSAGKPQSTAPSCPPLQAAAFNAAAACAASPLQRASSSVRALSGGAARAWRARARLVPSNVNVTIPPPPPYMPKPMRTGQSHSPAWTDATEVCGLIATRRSPANRIPRPPGCSHLLQEPHKCPQHHSRRIQQTRCREQRSTRGVTPGCETSRLRVAQIRALRNTRF